MEGTEGQTSGSALPHQPPGCVFEQQRYYSPAEVQERTGITVGALAVMRHRGDGPRFTKLGRRTFYKGEWLIAYLDAGNAGNTAEASAKRKFSHG